MALNLKLPIFQRERERNKKRSALKETLEYTSCYQVSGTKLMFALCSKRPKDSSGQKLPIIPHHQTKPK